MLPAVHDVYSGLQVGKRIDVSRHTLHEIAVAVERPLARQRITMSPSQVPVLLRTQFVGHNSKRDRLAVVVIDRRRKQTETVARVSSTFLLVREDGLNVPSALIEPVQYMVRTPVPVFRGVAVKSHLSPIFEIVGISQKEPAYTRFWV